MLDASLLSYLSELAPHSLAFAIGVAASVVASIIYSRYLRAAEKRFSFERIIGETKKLVNDIENDDFRPDIVVAIDRNSAIVGGLLCGHLGLSTFVTVNTDNLRNPDGSRDISISKGFLPDFSVFSSKKVLVFIAFNDSGTSLATIFQTLSANADALEVRTAALFSSASPKIVPRYCPLVVGKNLKTPINELMPKMPWVTSSWKHVFSKERYGSRG